MLYRILRIATCYGKFVDLWLNWQIMSERAKKYIDLDKCCFLKMKMLLEYEEYAFYKNKLEEWKKFLQSTCKIDKNLTA